MKAVKRVEQSYGRCLLTEGFLEAFYRRFLASSVIVRERFRNTDMDRQARVLRQSISAMIAFAAGNEVGRSSLMELVELHDRNHLAIEPTLYSYWRDSLLETVAEFDPKFDELIEDEWRQVLEPGIRLFTTNY